MKAAVLHEFGGQLAIEEMPVKEPGENRTSPHSVVKRRSQRVYHRHEERYAGSRGIGVT
jgi:hypothetical protein